MADRIGVVTVTYNSGQVIDDFMRSALAQSHEEFDLYIIDNASRDDTLLRVRAFPDPRVRIVANDQNLGVAEGNNQGIRLALESGCQFVLLINNDTEFDAGLFVGMLNAIQERSADMLVPKIMYFEPRDVIWCAGGYFKPWRGYVTGHFGDGEYDKGQFDRARLIAYAPTCCMLIRSEVFATVGLMDSKYFVYGDDTDFCWRAKRAGIRLWYDSRGLLYHKVSSLTGGAESDFTIQYTTRNKVYFALKNLGAIRILYCLLLFQLIFLVKLALRMDPARVYFMNLRSYVRGINLYLGRGA